MGNDDRSLEGRIALIQGASSGMGRIVALALARQGAEVIVAARRADACEAVVAAISAAGGRALALPVDVTDTASLDRQALEIERRFGRLDLALNNAGTTLGASPTHETPLERFRQTLEANLVGTFNAMQREIPLMLRAGGGSIVNTSSIGGVRGFANIQDYCAAKWGLIGLTKSAALEYAERNIRINAIAPGLIATEAFARAKASFPQIIDSRLAEVPMGHPGTMDDVAGVVTWLLGRGSQFVTGAVIPIDGGERARQPA
jgi:NAD(P)-dependent dehydrogenase (short-subunit alcohol dehydrogenase family)